MRTRTLGPLEVSVVGLGCNNFGRRVDQAGTRAVVDAALGAGVNFFDTAGSYGGGQSETFLGEALHGRREKAVLATKFGGGGKVGYGKGSREKIRRALEASLQRLQTDYVDLYQHHQEDPQTPLAETIAALDDLVREGKIRAYGTSNYSAAEIEKAEALAGRHTSPNRASTRGLHGRPSGSSCRRVRDSASASSPTSHSPTGF